MGRVTGANRCRQQPASSPVPHLAADEGNFRQRLRDLCEVMIELSKAPSFDELCRQAVLLGRQRLCFERLGLWFRSSDPNVAEGSFGTDEHGQLRDERGIRVRATPDSKLGEIWRRKAHVIVQPAEPIRNQYGEVVGQGAVAFAAMWDGETVVGSLNCDNHLTGRPLTDYDAELLSLYASALGPLCSRKRADEALLDYQAKLRALGLQLSLAEEHERRRIATELHDRLGQNLAGCGIKLQSLRARLGGHGCDHEFDAILDLLEETCESLSSLTFELYPPMLQQEGFVAAVEWLVGEFRERHGLNVRLQTRGRLGPLEQDTAAPLFQAVRELLHNALKHAQASRVRVLVQGSPQEVRVVVADNGIGLDPARLDGRRTGPGGFGLFGIRERLRELNGDLVVESAAGQGTRMNLVVRLNGETGQRVADHGGTDSSRR